MLPKCWRGLLILLLLYHKLRQKWKIQKYYSFWTDIGFNDFGCVFILPICHICKNREIQRTFYLFKQSVEQEKVLMQPGQMFLGDSKTELRSDSVIIETEKGKVRYKKNKQADSLALTDKREWFFRCSFHSKIPIVPLPSTVFSRRTKKWRHNRPDGCFFFTRWQPCQLFE